MRRWGRLMRMIDEDDWWGWLMRTIAEDNWWQQLIRTINEDDSWGQLMRFRTIEFNSEWLRTIDDDWHDINDDFRLRCCAMLVVKLLLQVKIRVGAKIFFTKISDNFSLHYCHFQNLTLWIQIMTFFLLKKSSEFFLKNVFLWLEK